MNYKEKCAAIACLGFTLAGSAHAQTNVQMPAGANLQIYGALNLNMSNYKPGDVIGGGSSWSLTDGTVNGNYGSRLGFKLTKELRGGLKATGLMEAGYAVDTGSSLQGGRLFGRQVYLSLASAQFGEIRAGRQYNPSNELKSLAQPLPGMAGDPGSSVTTAAGTLPQWVNPGRLDNLVQYLSPKFGGFNFVLLGAPGERVNDQYQGVRLNYVEGPLRASIAHEWNKDRVTRDATNKVTSLAAAYNFSDFKITGGLQRARDLTTSPGNVGAFSNLRVAGPTTFVVNKIDAYTAGVAVPMGGALTTAVNYVHTKYANAGNKLTLGKVALSANYDVDKDLSFYSSISVATGDLKEYIREKRLIQFGVNLFF
ncbi:porin [Noviherbaspirillum sedimenti]|uniref:Porin n=1 Tax=Noviherbaspirillum sedimenti TaxID=2320865 RepID=A0A3A3G611_9BURK|nr:porin [Noviherbaspirillum sedimenti]RJG03254.1 porin [Noviherbaspirillum sedimenti]